MSTSVLGPSTLMSRGQDRLIECSARDCPGRNKSPRGYCSKPFPPADSGPRRLLGREEKRRNTMNRIVIGARTGRVSQVAFWSRLSSSALTMLAVAILIFAASAQAQCGLPTKLVKPTSWHPQLGQAHLLRTELGGQDDLLEIGPSIVGMWHVTFTAQTMNGSSIPNTVIDNALVVWHADKT